MHHGGFSTSRYQSTVAAQYNSQDALKNKGNISLRDKSRGSIARTHHMLRQINLSKEKGGSGSFVGSGGGSNAAPTAMAGKQQQFVKKMVMNTIRN